MWMGARTGRGGEEIGKEKETVEKEEEKEEEEEEEEDALGVVETDGDHRLELCQ